MVTVDPTVQTLDDVIDALIAADDRLDFIDALPSDPDHLKPLIAALGERITTTEVKLIEASVTIQSEQATAHGDDGWVPENVDEAFIGMVLSSCRGRLGAVAWGTGWAAMKAMPAD